MYKKKSEMERQKVKNYKNQVERQAKYGKCLREQGKKGRDR